MRCILPKFSRDKGARVERNLVEYLKLQGWSEVFRVPLSGAMKGYKGDVVARPIGYAQEWNFEVKARAAGFDKVYDLVTQEGETFRSSVGGTLVSISYHPMQLLEANHHYPDSSIFKPEVQKILKYVLGRQEWLGEANILALKQDRRPFIFVRYR